MEDEDARPVEYIKATHSYVLLPHDSSISWRENGQSFAGQDFNTNPNPCDLTSLPFVSLSDVLLNELVSDLSLLEYKLISIGMLSV
jgi:hypothetical protein